MTETIGQLTAPNLQVEAANGLNYAYRRFGNSETPALPLLMLVDYRANLDNWDPALVDSLAQEREVILVDNVGVGSSSGTTPGTVVEMALGVMEFSDALGIRGYDLLGFSLGGFIAQELAMRRPYAVRRLVLAGTGPEGGRDMHVYSGRIREIALSDQPAIDDLLTLFFEPTESSQLRGQEFIKRIVTRRTDRDELVDLATRDAQLTAISAWGIPDATRLNRLAAITQPVLVANGDNDRMVPTENTHLLAQHLPNATLTIYPDAGHGFLFQYVTRQTADRWQVTLNAPPLNLVTPELVSELHEFVETLESDQQVKVVVFDSANEAFFLSHFDLGRATAFPFVADGRPAWIDMVVRLAKAPAISIASIRGRTRGGGDEFALACDLRYASRERAIFQQPEVGVGILPGGGASERLPRLAGRDRALEAILTSDDYDAATAERYGWVTRALPDAELDAFVDSLAERLAGFDRQALSAAKA